MAHHYIFSTLVEDSTHKHLIEETKESKWLLKNLQIECRVARWKRNCLHGVHSSCCGVGSSKITPTPSTRCWSNVCLAEMGRPLHINTHNKTSPQTDSVWQWCGTEMQQVMSLVLEKLMVIDFQIWDLQRKSAVEVETMINMWSIKVGLTINLEKANKF